MSSILPDGATAATALGVPGVGTVYGVLLNDPATLARLDAELRQPPYRAPPVAPVLYIKPRNTFATDGAAVAIPADPGRVRIGATIGAVIGRRATRVAAAAAPSFVRAFRIVSDVSLPQPSYYRPGIRHRCRDGFCPMGDEIAAPAFDVAAAAIVVSIDGVEAERRTLDGLVRGLPALVEALTAFTTLDAGDVVLVGLSDAPPLATPGQRVRIDVAGLGSLSHTIVVEERAA